MPYWGWGLIAGILIAAFKVERAMADEGDHGGGSGGGGASMSMGNVPNLSDKFWQDLWAVANDLGADPHVLGLLLFEESGIDPKAKNSIGCVGINQFCDGTFEGFVNISKAAYLALPAEGQLPYVKKYWAAGPSGSLATARDIFWRSLLPATWKPNADASAVVNDPAILGADYAAKVAKANPIGHNGVITAGDIDAYLARVAQAPGWALAQDKLAQFDPSSGGGSSVATNPTDPAPPSNGGGSDDVDPTDPSDPSTGDG